MTAGSSWRTCGPTSPSCGPTPASSCSSWAPRSARSPSGPSPASSTGGSSTTPSTSASTASSRTSTRRTPPPPPSGPARTTARRSSGSTPTTPGATCSRSSVAGLDLDRRRTARPETWCACPTSRRSRTPTSGSGCPRPASWHEVLNTDAGTYTGSGVGNLGSVTAHEGQHGSQPAHATLVVPPLATVWFRRRLDGAGRRLSGRRVRARAQRDVARRRPARVAG